MRPESFVLPFLFGIVFLLVYIVIRFTRWILKLSKFDKIRILKSILTLKTWISVKEAFMEGLLHRRIFRKNRVLGYMHMSLAFGWFLLIVAGHIETMISMKTLTPPFHYSIFHRYFFTEPNEGYIHGILPAMMDLLLLFILTGVGLAYYKRFNRKVFGMQKTTRLKSGDRIALLALWFIFPFRFFAESFSAGIYHNGSFLSQPAGDFFALFLPLQSLLVPMWFSYSLALGMFFISLPNSRYMHIPAEILYIFLKNYGVSLKKRANSYSLVQVFSCSRCGICIDSCQLNDANINTTQSVYVLKHIRNNNLTDETLFNCLLCGRCQQACPVGIDLNNLRITQRIESTLQYNSTYPYLTNGSPQKTDVVYFAGCMTHLTPGIKRAMTSLMEMAQVNYWFMDEFKAPCCGRPLMQAGQYDAAQKLIENNQSRILGSGAKILVASCPICYKVFNEDYSLPGVRVLHHSEYLLELARKKLIHPVKIPGSTVYHDPCELGRGSNIYEQPRELLGKFLRVSHTENEKENGLCCGGSLGNLKISAGERDKIRDRTLSELIKNDPDYLATSCPLCKKTFAKGKDLPVYDISELMLMAVEAGQKPETSLHRKKAMKEVEVEEV